LLYYGVHHENVSDIRAVEGASREGWYTPLLYGCRVQLN
jgi:hypothetical protein